MPMSGSVAGYSLGSADSLGAVGSVPLPAEPALTPGWATAAESMYAALRDPRPTLMRIDIAGHPPVAVDFPRRQFFWEGSIERFPDEPSRVSVRTVDSTPETAAALGTGGQDLAILLWTVGMESFGGTPATWLRPGDRYRLSQWPNFTVLPRRMAHLRMTAALVNAYLSIDELATVTATPVSDVQRLVNALTLLDVVDVAADAPSDLAAWLPEPAPEKSLFRRLRDRLGL